MRRVESIKSRGRTLLRILFISLFLIGFLDFLAFVFYFLCRSPLSFSQYIVNLCTILSFLLLLYICTLIEQISLSLPLSLQLVTFKTQSNRLMNYFFFFGISFSTAILLQSQNERVGREREVLQYTVVLSRTIIRLCTTSKFKKNTQPQPFREIKESSKLFHLFFFITTLFIFLGQLRL